MTRCCPQMEWLVRRAQLILKGLFNCFVTLCVGKSAFSELETTHEVGICPIRPHCGSGTC